MTELIKLSNIKGIEILSMNGQIQSFPNHYHKYFCVSLITEGIECMKIDNNLIYTEKNHISITNPYEIHSNPLNTNHQRLSFYTIYIPQNVIDEIANRENVWFEKRSFKDLELNKLFLNIIEFTTEHKNELNLSLLEKFIIRLLIHSKETAVIEDSRFKTNWEKAITFINKNLKNEINLESLALHCEMDKFKFAKAFKYFSGMSPMNYVLMQRVFEAKEKILKKSNLTDIAYEYNFTDMAHFSKQFKRFVGLSPRNYQKTLSA